MILFLLGLLLFRPPDKTAVFAIQQISFKVNGEEAGQWNNEIAIGKNRVRIDKDNYSLIYDFRLQLFIYIDHATKRYQISNSTTARPAIRRFFTGLAPIVKGNLERNQDYIVKLNKKKVVAGFPCVAYKLNYPDHLGVETVLWTFPHPVFSTSEYRRLVLALLGSDVPGDAKFVLNHILGDVWGTPLLMVTTLQLGDDVVEISSGFSYLELRKNMGFQIFEIPKGYSMGKDMEIPVETLP